MKRVIIALAFLVTAGNLVSCKDANASSKVKKENLVKAEERNNDISKGAPVVSFDKTEHNFGTVKEGEIIETSFIVSNSGKSDLVITNATSTCGCTVPTWPKNTPIAPGESAEIGVKFNTNGKPNKQTKAVTLFTNTAAGREIVKITGMVIPKAKPTAKKPNA